MDSTAQGVNVSYMRVAVRYCLLPPLLLWANAAPDTCVGVMGLHDAAPIRRSARLKGGKVGPSELPPSRRRRSSQGAPIAGDGRPEHAKKGGSVKGAGDDHGTASSASVAGRRPKRMKRTPPPPTEAAEKGKKIRTLGRSREEKKREEGFRMVIGVDEAGRGPFAGPVVAAACHVPPEVLIAGIQDSKKVTAISARELLYEELIAAPGVKWAVSVVGSDRIDDVNILEATKEAMTKCALELCDKAPNGTKPFVLVDGNFTPPGLSGVDTDCVIGGDGVEYCIAAASIIAKVTRDRMMIDYGKRWPEFGFEKHKGYGTQGHRDAIRKHGPVEIHRRSFLKNMEAEGKLPKYKGKLR